MSANGSQPSAFYFYSHGVVVEDSPEDGDYIKVTPGEELPQVSGRLSEAKYDYKTMGTDHKGVMVNTAVKGVGHLVCKWISFEGGNRNTSPNVYEGESVMLYKFGSGNDVFWTTIGRETELRRLENVIYSYSNLSKKGSGAYDQDSSYWMQVSTRDKIIRLVTNDNDGEAAAYDFQIDTAKGTFSIVDSYKNSIFLDSVNGDLKVDLNNSIELNSKMIRINGETYVRTTGDEITDMAKSMAKYLSEGSWQADAAAKIELLKSTDVTGKLYATVDVLAMAISLVLHTHLYHPGNGGNTPSDPPS